MSTQPFPFDEAPQRALDRARPALQELLCVWPAERRKHLVLWVTCGHEGQLAVGARARTRAGAAGSSVDLAVRGIRGIPVVVELDGGRTAVLPFGTG